MVIRNGSSGVGLIHKALNHNHKIPKRNSPSALSHRWSDVVANPKTLIARARTMVSDDANNRIVAADRIAVVERLDEFSIL